MPGLVAPFKGPSRSEVLKMLGGWFAKRKLPLTLSHQCVPAGDKYYMPEMTWRFLEPSELLASSESKKEFISLIEQIDWPFD